MTDASLKLQGPWEVCRKIRIPAIAHPADARPVERALSQVPGVRALCVDIARRRLKVRYEITETDYQAIEEALEGVGFPPADGWWARRRANWLQSLDLTGRENAAVKPSPCCNRPPAARR